MFLIGIDIGGTNLKLGLIEDGTIVDKIEVPTNSFDLIKQLESVTNQLLSKNNLDIKEVSGVGVGCPGIVIDGILKYSPNLILNDCNLKGILTEVFGGIPVVIKNDADMATLAENKFGAGVGTKNMILLTIGTVQHLWNLKSSCITETLYLLNSSSLFPPAPNP